MRIGKGSDREEKKVKMREEKGKLREREREREATEITRPIYSVRSAKIIFLWCQMTLSDRKRETRDPRERKREKKRGKKEGKNRKRMENKERE